LGQVQKVRSDSRTQNVSARRAQTTGSFELAIAIPNILYSIDKKSSDLWSFTDSFHEDYFEDYLSWLPEAERKTCEELVHGFFEIREANGFCYASPFGNIVLISYGLKHFLFYMNLYLFGESMGVTFDDRVHALFIACRIMLDTEAPDFLIDQRGSLP
jgi:hypothetical protein